ncbi:hypothetical protein D3C72_823770 [compost metagenome]
MGLLNSRSLDSAQEEHQLSYLERIAYRIHSDKMLGMILRQKSYFLEGRGHFLSALESAEAGLAALRHSAPLSDIQLMYLHKADLLLSLKRYDEAATVFHGILGPFENRVLFALDFVKSRVTNNLPPNPADYLVVPKVWRSKLLERKNSKSASTHLTSIWKSAEGTFVTEDGTEISVKRDSIEGRILTLLANGRKDRAALCLALWPDDVDTELLNDRLKKSIKRLKSKVPNIVIFAHGYYNLGSGIKIA